jgi:hypothetical protein
VVTVAYDQQITSGCEGLARRLDTGDPLYAGRSFDLAFIRVFPDKLSTLSGIDEQDALLSLAVSDRTIPLRRVAKWTSFAEYSDH